MSHLVIVGGTSGIGRDIQKPLRICGHRVTKLPRTPHWPGLPAYNVDALLFSQRFRGDGDEWEGEIDASLTKSKVLFQWADLYLPQDGTGSIVVMSSVAGVSVEEEQPVGYHMAKAALLEMVRYYAVTLAPRIRVNAIIPGLTIKPEARGFYDDHPMLEEVYKNCTPLGRMGTVEDIANLVDFLISEKSSYLTGQTITLDGGIGLRSHWALARRVSPSLRALQVTQRKPA